MQCTIYFAESPWHCIRSYCHDFFLFSSTLWTRNSMVTRVHLWKFFDPILSAAWTASPYPVDGELTLRRSFGLTLVFFFFALNLNRFFSVDWFISRFISVHESDGCSITTFMRNLFASHFLRALCCYENHCMSGKCVHSVVVVIIIIIILVAAAEAVDAAATELL